jgi:hypothetical protein
VHGEHGRGEAKVARTSGREPSHAELSQVLDVDRFQKLREIAERVTAGTQKVEQSKEAFAKLPLGETAGLFPHLVESFLEA